MTLFLFDLPSDVFSSEICSYFCDSDVYNLDNAVTNHLLRPLLYHIYKHADFNNILSPLVCLDASVTKWLCSRSIKMKSMQLFREMQSQEISEIFRLLELTPSVCIGIKSFELFQCARNILHSHYSQLLNVCGDQLEHLNLSQCKYITKRLLTRIGKKCQNLSSIDFQDCNISDAAITALASNCNNLRKIDLSAHLNFSNRATTDISICSVAHHCAKLTSINLHSCKNVTNSSLIALSQGCKFITELDIGCCESVTDLGVKAIAQECHFITKFDAHCCLSISDLSIVPLAEGCHDMKWLDVSYCGHITDLSITAMVRNCKKLRNLRLYSLSDITDEAIGTISQICPHILRDETTYG